MSTKFGFLIDFDLLKAVTSTNTKLEVVFSDRGRHLEKWICLHIFAMDTPIWTKFVSLMQKNTPKWSRSKPELEFQYGGRLFFKTGSSYISTVNWDMSTKFGLLIDFDILKPVTSTDTKPVAFSGCGRHLEKWIGPYDVIFSQWVLWFGRNSVAWCRKSRRLWRNGRGQNRK